MCEHLKLTISRLLRYKAHNEEMHLDCTDTYQHIMHQNPRIRQIMPPLLIISRTKLESACRLEATITLYLNSTVDIKFSENIFLGKCVPVRVRWRAENAPPLNKHPRQSHKADRKQEIYANSTPSSSAREKMENSTDSTVLQANITTVFPTILLVFISLRQSF